MGSIHRGTFLSAATVMLARAVVARAQATEPPPPEPAAPPAAERPRLEVTPMGYVEASYSYNFNRPSNGITAFRGFDNRHDTFTLSNVALGGSWKYGLVDGKLLLQVGQTPSSYYASEPVHPGGAGVNASGPELWKYIQEAWVGYTAPVGRGLHIQAGVFLSPIGPETIPIKDTWNWSRSNLFFGLPFYHTGVRFTQELSDRWTVSAAVYNGWNSVVDNNEEKSVSAAAAYKDSGTFQLQVLYFGGVERPTGSPEGPYWRHDFDAYAEWDPLARLSLLVHGNTGWEPNRFGTSRWYAGAVYARVKLAEFLYVAGRGDRFWEDVAENASGRATPLFWPAPWVSSGTATVDVRPHEQISVRLEYRHDQADGDIYFRSTVAGDGSAGQPFVPNADSQDTITLGATTWF